MAIDENETNIKIELPKKVTILYLFKNDDVKTQSFTYQNNWTVSDLRAAIVETLSQKNVDFILRLPKGQVLEDENLLSKFNFTPFQLIHAVSKNAQNNTIPFTTEKSVIVYPSYSIPRPPIDFNKKSDTGFVGLSNQGATCYMNSLIQTLYMTPEFRLALYKWDSKEFFLNELKSQLNSQPNPDPTKQKEFEDKIKKISEILSEPEKINEYIKQKEETSVPSQLQKLFARLQLSQQRAVKTTDLTKSFGWKDSDAFTQHDVQELCRVLFDAIEQSCKNSPDADIVKRLYQGKMRDYVQCGECNYSSSRTDAFLDVSLSIKPFGAVKAIGNIEEALEQYITSEILEGDNQYFCERCQRKVKSAKKGLIFDHFPSILTLQLKRFDFDYERFERVKLEDRVTFPNILDVESYLSDEAKTANPGGYKYELFSVLIHRGSSGAGHYYAYIKSFDTQQWYEFNDSMVSSIVEQDICNTFGQPSRSFFSASPTAYMLMYRKSSPENINKVNDNEIPIELKSIVEQEDVASKQTQMEQEASKQKISLRLIYSGMEKQLKTTIKATIGETIEQALKIFNISKPKENFRLYECVEGAYLPTAYSPEKTLNASNIFFNKSIYLEEKDDDDTFSTGTFWDSVYRVFIYDKQSLSWKGVKIIYFQQSTTVGEMKQKFAEKFKIPIDLQEITYANYQQTIQLRVDDNLLIKNIIQLNSKVFLEERDDSIEKTHGYFECERLRNSFFVFLVPPGKTEFEFSYRIQRGLTARLFKELISNDIKMQPSEFVLLSINYSQKLEIYNEDSTQYFFDGAQFAVEVGKQIHSLSVHLFHMNPHKENSKEPELTDYLEELGNVNFDNSAKFSDIKPEIVNLVNKKLNQEYPIERIMLRQITWKSPASVLPDDSFVRDKIFHVKSLAAQILSENEKYDNEKLYIFVRRWHPSTFVLGPVQQMAISRSPTHESLKKDLSDYFNVPFDNVSYYRLFDLQAPSILDIPTLAWAQDSAYFYISEGSMLIFKDTAEQLKELSQEELKNLKKQNPKKRSEEKALKIQINNE
eukprot:TRINITY_DN419_c1_g1_i1.p1 TRINITY_DN419_c1_g1~~TRINITY_DN419_c1_g1_i1.p1  ORF type:complete len:1042 (-),score=430.06 TRINITY_DN419_c1_g1_i1:209-3334(-)